MSGRIASLHRHPIKGFTPERLLFADLLSGQAFPCDRLWAIERGCSGFDPEAPRHLSKQRFTVLANHPSLARAVTRYDEETTRLSVRLAGGDGLSVRLAEASGRERLAGWIAAFLGEGETQPLRVLHAGVSHRFMDDAAGAVSLVNLQSVRDLAGRAGRSLDPLRLRANVYVEGWEAWAERDLLPGARLQLGGVEVEVVKPITRCVATHVNPETGERDVDLVGLLRQHYGALHCGLYLRVVTGGRLVEGDAAAAISEAVLSAPCPPQPRPPLPQPWSRPGPPPAIG
jgi:uncharacterized protein